MCIFYRFQIYDLEIDKLRKRLRKTVGHFKNGVNNQQKSDKALLIDEERSFQKNKGR